mgnify:FL=1
MWYNIIKQDNFTYHIPFESWGEELVVAFSNYSIALIDSLPDLRELTQRHDIKKRRQKMFRNLVKAIFYKIYTEVINGFEIGHEIDKDEFYEKVFVEMKKYTISYDRLQIARKSGKHKIIMANINLEKFVTKSHTKSKYEIYYSYSIRKTPYPMSDLISRGYIESLSASDQGDTHEASTSFTTSLRQVRTLERVRHNKFIIRRHVPTALYLDKLRPFMGKGAAPTNRSGTIWTVKD